MKYQKNKLGVSALLLFSLIGCTGQIPGSFRFLQQEQTFTATQGVNTKIDLLWVVDNSSSMDVHQQKLRNGFQSFASKYLQPTWDIRVAVITTDTYLANGSYSTYLQTTVPGSVGYVSTYLSALPWLNTFVNPVWDPTLVNTTTGAFPHGITYNGLNPTWGSTYALLHPGIHDGPMTAFCFEAMPYFLKGVTLCNIRDNPAGPTGPDACVSPDTGAGQSSYSQCVNTVQNNTVRSGRAIISTQPPAGTPGNAAWVAQLNRDFMINASVGSSGAGSERGLSSLLQMISDNEVTATAFFRPNSLRGIIFLSDEDDQSFQVPAPLPGGFSPDWGYMCDEASLLANNGGSAVVNGNGGLCCNVPANHCKFGSLGTSCPSKTVDGYTYTLGVCADQTKLVSVDSVKQQLDQFFAQLDSTNTSANLNYFVISITPTTGSSIQTIQNSRVAIDTAVGTIKVSEGDRGDRYIALGQLVGNGSLTMDIGASDYSPVLDAIGQDIVQKKSNFVLARAPTTVEEMIVAILHADGTSYVVPSSKFTISGKTLTFTDPNFVLSLTSTDRVSINYQPKTAY